MNLHQHEEFPDALVAAAGHHELARRFVEKDHYVTKVLMLGTTGDGARARGLGERSLFGTLERCCAGRLIEKVQHPTAVRGGGAQGTSGVEFLVGAEP